MEEIRDSATTMTTSTLSQTESAPLAATAPPVFLIGSIRSGTTMLRLMLDHHPRVSFLHEAMFLFECPHPPGEDPSVEALHAFLENDWIFQRSGLRLDTSLDYREAVDDLLRQRGRAAGADVVGATVHKMFDETLRLYPDARFVHMIRDGRDVANSVANMGVEGNLYYASERWLRAVEEWRRLRARLRADQFIEVRFETLVREPESELPRICAFLGIDASAEMLSYAESTTYDRPDASAAERWRRLKDWTLRPATIRMRDDLLAFGYEVDEPLRKATIGPFARLGLLRNNIRRKIRFRVRRYGLGLYLARQAVKILPLARLRRRIVLACQAKDIEAIK
jgi:hypothetical protein